MEDKRYAALMSKSISVRGALINDIIFLEKVIDQWLSEYFCSNKTRQYQLFELVFCNDRLTYSSKIQVFGAIVDKHCPTFEALYPNFKKELANIGEARKIFAHWVLNTTDEYLDSNELRFTKSKNFSDGITYTNGEILALTEMVDKYKFGIAKLVQPPLIQT